MRQAQMSAAKDEDAPVAEKHHHHNKQAAPSFLQVNAHDQYKNKGDGLISTLQDLQGKVKKERDEALKAEEKQKKDFKEWESGLVTMLENGKKSLADIRSSIAQSQEQSAQKQ